MVYYNWIKNTEVNVHWFYKQYGNFDTIFSLLRLVLVCHIVNKIFAFTLGEVYSLLWLGLFFIFYFWYGVLPWGGIMLNIKNLTINLREDDRFILKDFDFVLNDGDKVGQ